MWSSRWTSQTGARPTRIRSLVSGNVGPMPNGTRLPNMRQLLRARRGRVTPARADRLRPRRQVLAPIVGEIHAFVNPEMTPGGQNLIRIRPRATAASPRPVVIFLTRSKRGIRRRGDGAY